MGTVLEFPSVRVHRNARIRERIANLERRKTLLIEAMTDEELTAAYRALCEAPETRTSSTDRLTRDLTAEFEKRGLALNEDEPTLRLV